jgi:hypothetical protein
MLLAREQTTAVKVTERLFGLQAQWPKPPFVGLWTRLADFTPDVLARLLAKKTLVRATMMRGTIHVVTAEDYLVHRATIAEVLARGMASILKERGKGLDVARLVERARAFLDEEPRTFAELRAFLRGGDAGADERAMGFAVRCSLPLVMVPTDARWAFPADADFVPAETWLGKRLAAQGDTRALVLRYLAAFGPATVADAQTWSGLQGLRTTFAALRPGLVTFADERGRELFDLPRAPRPDQKTPAPVRFLPEFDNLLLGHADRTRIVADAHRAKVFLAGLRVAATFLVDGQVAGTWKALRTKQRALLEVTPFGALAPRTARELAAEAEALARFLEPDADDIDVKVKKGR